MSIAHPERHIFGITIRVPGVQNQLILQMPAWNALYQIRDFSSHMMQVSAGDAAGQLASRPGARQTDLAGDGQRQR